MFGDKFEKQMAEVSRDVEPYRNMALSLEIDQRLKDMELELLGYDRSLLTSNDRYQMASAYLSLARNRVVVMDAIYDGLAGAKNAPRGRELNAPVVTAMMLKGYEQARTGVEEADRITAQIGYKADPLEAQSLTSFANQQFWQGNEVLSNPFIVGSVNAIDNLLANTSSHFNDIVSNPKLPNDFKLEIKRQVQTLVNEVMNRQKAVNRLTNGLPSAVQSEPVMADIYENLRESLTLSDQIESWLTMPRLHNQSFTLSRPLDERNPKPRSFKPDMLGQPVVKQAVQQPTRPLKPFSPGILSSPPKEQAAAPKTPAAITRPFSPDSLKPASQPKPFDPNQLQTKTARPQKHFDPDTLK